MRHGLLLFGAALLGLGLSLPFGLARADGKSERANVMPVSQVKRGMKGYGLTVFEGTRPERFDVEVIDVLKNFRPRQDLILVKTKHPRLEVAKAVAGVTPIDNMIDDLVRPVPSQIFGWPLKTASSGKAAGARAANDSARFR